MVPDTTPEHQRQIACYEALQEVKAERDEAREERDSAQQMVGVLINSLDECRDRGMALVAELRSRGWTGEVEEL